jgi:branched-chain amino acid transport system ATP-binding protein
MLTVAGLRVAYGPIEVLKDLAIDVPGGAIVCLIGANGAGKTTLLNTLSGLIRPRAGELRFEGERIDGLPPEQVVRRGIVQVPEGRKVFRNLTVAECLRVGGLTRQDKIGVQRDIDEMYERFPRLRERRRQLAGTLSGGEQQMLAFGRALVARPKLLLLDEPSMGLAPAIVQAVSDLIVDIRKRGVTILLVEQNVELALGIADDGYLLETGRITLAGTAENLRHNDEVRRSYLGL